MFEPTGRGRRRKYDFCNDCGDLGLTREPNEQGQVAGEKEFGSYCKRHAYERNKVSRQKRVNPSARKAVTHGDWLAIPGYARPQLDRRFREQMYVIVTNYPRDRACAESFEFDCARAALSRGSRISVEEEDRLIRNYHGSREKGRKISLLGPPGPADAQHRILLPDPEVRETFRATIAGPTTEGEPSFTDYYRQHFGEEPPEHLREDRPRGTPGPKTEADTYVRASDGKEVRADKLAEYEDYLRTQREAKQRREEEPPAEGEFHGGMIEP
jgi:hypothetical protein